MKGKVFTAQEVQSILNGTKVMFREVIKPKINLENYSLPDECGMELLLSECPYKVGQEIFCKEAFENVGKINYKAQMDIDYPDYKPISTWKPAQHMKQEHSRLTLLIKSIGVEKLKDISDEDCKKEGVITFKKGYPPSQFAVYWNATHKKPEEKFEANPWVWCVSFEIINN